MTYLVFDAESAVLAGYYAIAIKPLSIKADTISKTAAKKIARVSILDEESGTYTTSAYLIAQLGKNYALPPERRIAGNDLLDFALRTVAEGKFAFGGVVQFLECADLSVLLDFYAANGFRLFDFRMTRHHGESDSFKLHQLLRFI